MISLSLAQIALLVRLDDGFEHEDSVGWEINQFRGHQFGTADSLFTLGLVEIVKGQFGKVWCCLTVEGFRVRDEWRAFDDMGGLNAGEIGQTAHQESGRSDSIRRD